MLQAGDQTRFVLVPVLVPELVTSLPGTSIPLFDRCFHVSYRLRQTFSTLDPPSLLASLLEVYPIEPSLRPWFFPQSLPKCLLLHRLSCFCFAS